MTAAQGPNHALGAQLFAQEHMRSLTAVARVNEQFTETHANKSAAGERREMCVVGIRTLARRHGKNQIAADVADRGEIWERVFHALAAPGEIGTGVAGLVAGAVDGRALDTRADQAMFASDSESAFKQRCEAPF